MSGADRAGSVVSFDCHIFRKSVRATRAECLFRERAKHGEADVIGAIPRVWRERRLAEYLSKVNESFRTSRLARGAFPEGAAPHASRVSRALARG